jgi:hypothetical protein
MKFCAFLFAAMMASASAFAPSSKATTTTALNQAIDYNPNLGGATSNDPVDQTLMTMVRSVSCLIASNDDGFPRRSDWHHWSFLSFSLSLHQITIIFLTQSFFFSPPFRTHAISMNRPNKHLSYRMVGCASPPLLLLCDRCSSQRTFPSAKCKEEEPSEPGTSPQRPSVSLITSAPTDVP